MSLRVHFCHRYFSNCYSQAGYIRLLLSIKKDVVLIPNPFINSINLQYANKRYKALLSLEMPVSKRLLR